MVGKLGILGAAIVLAAATGCTMCCHPYDECGPVYDEASGRSYCTSVRAGSILEERVREGWMPEDRAQPVTPAISEGTAEENPQGVSSAVKRLPTTVSKPRALAAADRSAAKNAPASKTQTAQRPVKRAMDDADQNIWRW